MPFDCHAQLVLARRPRRLHRRQDPATRGMELLVARSRGTQRELLYAVSDKARVRVAVDEPRNRAEAPSVDLGEVARRRLEVAHLAGCDDAPSLTQDEGLLDNLNVTKRRAAQR